MSLLNNMLNDLEKRRIISGAGQPLSDSGLEPPPRSAGNRAVIQLVLFAAAAGAGAWIWSEFRATPAHSPAPPTVVASGLPKAAPAPSPAPAAMPAEVPAPVAVAVAANVPTSPEPAISPATSPEALSAHAASAPAHSASSSGVAISAHKDAAATRALAPAAPAEPTETISLAAPAAKPSAPVQLAKAATPSRQRPNAETSFKVVRPEQRSDNLYRQAVSQLQQSKAAEAQQTLRKALDANINNHNARKLLAELLIDAGNDKEAATLLKDGLELAPGHTDFSMVLARLQVAGGANNDAVATLEQGLAAAGDDAEYHAFLAALLQKQGRHADAVQHYLVALRSDPSMPSWLVGVGISLEAEDKMNDAAAAFQRAIDTGELSVEVAQFADQQLKQIRQPR